MFYKLTKAFGKPICVALYGAFAALAARRKPLPLLILALMHATEYLTVGRRVAQQRGVKQGEALAQCLAFGFTWWLPLKKEAE